MKKLLSLICVLSIAVACSACGKEPNPAGISLEEFQKIDTGMGWDKVDEIVGGEGTLISEKEEDFENYTEKTYVYRYEGELNGYAEIEFTKQYSKEIFGMDFSDPEVTAKTQYDLS